MSPHKKGAEGLKDPPAKAKGLIGGGPQIPVTTLEKAERINIKDDESSTSRIEVPSEVSEPLGVADFQVLRASESRPINCTQVVGDDKHVKPRGSASVSAKMQIMHTGLEGHADICIDTGADITVCTSAFLIKCFGHEALQHINASGRLPRLQSATGHLLKVLGRIHLKLTLGTFCMQLKVVVQENHILINFLMGSDVLYGRMIFDKGKFLAFGDGRHQPVPIKYKLDQKVAKVTVNSSVAPKSSALITVQVTKDPQLVGQSILLSSLNELIEPTGKGQGHEKIMVNQCPIKDTVAMVGPEGCAMVMVENSTEDILTFLAGDEIAAISLAMEEDDPFIYDQADCYAINKVPEVESKGDDSWLKQALNPNFLERKLPNLVVREENVDLPEDMSINFVHSKEDKRQLLDGIGDGFPLPPSAEPFEQELEEDPNAWLENIEHSHLDDQQWVKLKEVLLKYQEAFSRSKKDIGCCKYFKAQLPLKPGTGYLHSKPRPLPHKHKEVARKTIDDLLEQGIIRPSKSPHATNIVVVNKKALNGVVQHRVCVDLRQVNENSVPNRFPNYQLEEAMAKIQGAALRTGFDFCNAFHQIMLTEESIPVTAFYFDNMLYEYVRVPFGHVCAMNLFCNVMALLCEGYPAAGYYADDLMVTTRTNPKSTKSQIFDQHLIHVSGMLQRIIDAGLKLKAHKCQWCYGADKPMEWLGFTMRNNLLQPQETKVAVVKDYPTPTSPRQCISFVSMVSFYRRFIKSFARIAMPIYDVAKQEHFEWTEAAQLAFDELKEALCSSPVLKLPRPELPFILYTDASHKALGCVLCQIDPDDNKEHPCAYGSRKFTDAEIKYSTPGKELLAIVYGLCLWSHYICGNPITVFSDCRAWTFLKIHTGINGKITRIALLVQEYDLSVSFVQGVKNKAADGLSRAFDDGVEACDNQSSLKDPLYEQLTAPRLDEGKSMKLSEYLDHCYPYLEKEWPKIKEAYDKDPQKFGGEAEQIDGLIQSMKLLHIDRWDTNMAEASHRYPPTEPAILEQVCSISLAASICPADDVSTIFDEPMTTDGCLKSIVHNIRLIALRDPNLSLEAFAEAQKDDEFCGKKLRQLKRNNPNVVAQGYFVKKAGNVKILLRQFVTTKDQEIFNVVCVPKGMVKLLLESSHGNLMYGHLGKQRFILSMSKKYYWKGMKSELEKFHDTCVPCQFNDKYPVRFSQGTVLRPLRPMHIVYYDLVMGLPRAKDGEFAILLFYDGFSRFTFGIPLASEKAEYIVKKIMSHFVAAFGLPWALHSDNGLNVDGSMIRHLARMLGVVKTTTPPYTPRSNPCETACGAVTMLIRKLLYNRDQRYWPVCLPFVLNALNSSVHTVTGYTPNSLFFATEEERSLVPLIPMEDESANVNEYYQKMRKFQELAYNIASLRSNRQKDVTKDKANLKATKPKFREGDYILIKDLSPGKGPGQRKLRAKYLGPYRVIQVREATLTAIPWSEGKAYDRYRDKPDLFRLRHRANIRVFHPVQVSFSHCKPYKGNIKPVAVWDKGLLKEFLDILDADNNADLQSVIVPRDDSMAYDSMYSSDGGRGPSPPPPGAPVGPDLGLAGPDDSDDDPDDFMPPRGLRGPDGDHDHVSPAPSDISSHVRTEPDMDDLFEDINLDPADEVLLRNHLLPEDQFDNAPQDQQELHGAIVDLLAAARDPHDYVRDQAQNELADLIDGLRGDNLEPANDQQDDQPDHEGQGDDQADSPPRGAGIEFDDEEFMARTPGQTSSDSEDSDHSSGGFTVKTPGFSIHVSPRTPGRPKVNRRGSDGRTLSGVPPSQDPPGNLQRWVDHTSPGVGLGAAHRGGDPPTVASTRSKRPRKAPERYDAAEINRQQRESQQFEKARRDSLDKSSMKTPEFRFGEWTGPRGTYSGRSRVGKTPPSRHSRSGVKSRKTRKSSKVKGDDTQPLPDDFASRKFDFADDVAPEDDNSQPDEQQPEQPGEDSQEQVEANEPRQPEESPNYDDVKFDLTKDFD